MAADSHLPSADSEPLVKEERDDVVPESDPLAMYHPTEWKHQPNANELKRRWSDEQYPEESGEMHSHNAETKQQSDEKPEPCWSIDNVDDSSCSFSEYGLNSTPESDPLAMDDVAIKRRQAYERRKRWLATLNQEELDKIRAMNAAAKRAARQQETPEQAAIRLQRMAAAKRAARQQETPEQRAARLQQNAESRRAARRQETPEQAEARRQKDAAAHSLIRAHGTPEQTEARRQREAAAKRAKRRRKTELTQPVSEGSGGDRSSFDGDNSANHLNGQQPFTEFCKLETLEQSEAHQGTTSRKETVEQADARRRKEATARAAARAQQTPQQKELRLQKQAAAKRAARQRAKLEQSLSDGSGGEHWLPLMLNTPQQPQREENISQSYGLDGQQGTPEQLETCPEINNAAYFTDVNQETSQHMEAHQIKSDGDCQPEAPEQLQPLGENNASDNWMSVSLETPNGIDEAQPIATPSNTDQSLPHQETPQSSAAHEDFFDVSNFFESQQETPEQTAAVGGANYDFLQLACQAATSEQLQSLTEVNAGDNWPGVGLETPQYPMAHGYGNA